ncbi:polysaccharide pyruvyl transferase family protein [Pseudaquidulcibacter saccharophilus]|uniref:polysaccharide pyruvyl transferase family protein n=1 Tax=Pseudaquidulcibacter saccharophilus TaxID=2831900 RepID=UPI001EFF2579|nr:polysaccharide pyruvyl transferase family protein [Pseudaquidulcibacter saccharophilus]
MNQKAEIYSNKNLAVIMKQLANGNTAFMPNPGNIGDAAIALGTYCYFDEMDLGFPVVKFDMVLKKYGFDNIIFGGGGGLINGVYYEQITSAINFLKSGGNITFLPCTAVDVANELLEYRDNITFFAREERTYNDFIDAGFEKKKVFLCHDMAFAIDDSFLQPYRKNVGRGRIAVLREDEESVNTNLYDSDANIDFPSFINGSFWHDRELTVRAVGGMLKQISQYSEVITNRLHVGILSSLIGKSVRLMPNAYNKNRSVFEFSLSNNKNVVFGDPCMNEIDQNENNKDMLNSKGWDSLRKKLMHYEKMRREWWEPEITRLNNDISERERIKKEWFEPELERLNVSNADLLNRVSEVENKYQSIKNNQISNLDFQLNEALSNNDLLAPQLIKLLDEKKVNEIALLRKELDHQLEINSNTLTMLNDCEQKFDEQAHQLTKLEIALKEERMRTIQIANKSASLNSKVQEYREQLRDKQAEIDEAWKVKTEWFEPQIEYKDLLIKILNNKLAIALGLDENMEMHNFDEDTLMNMVVGLRNELAAYKSSRVLNLYKKIMNIFR